VSKAALDLLATCDFPKAVRIRNVPCEKRHPHLDRIPDGLAGDHPDDMLITFPLTSGSVWTRAAEQYGTPREVHACGCSGIVHRTCHTPSAAFVAAAGLPEKEVAVAAQAWLAGIDAGNYAQTGRNPPCSFGKRSLKTDGAPHLRPPQAAGRNEDAQVAECEERKIPARRAGRRVCRDANLKPPSSRRTKPWKRDLHEGV